MVRGGGKGTLLTLSHGPERKLEGSIQNEVPQASKNDGGLIQMLGWGAAWFDAPPRQTIQRTKAHNI